jgi:hypothetical protein
MPYGQKSQMHHEKEILLPSEDRVIRYANLLQTGDQFGPDVAVGNVVFLVLARFDAQSKCDSRQFFFRCFPKMLACIVGCVCPRFV